MDRKKSEFPCVVCGEMFQITPYKYNIKKDKITCSKECSNLNKTKSKTKANSNNKYEFNCKICGEIFEIDRPSLYFSGLKTTCSRECTRRNMSNSASTNGRIEITDELRQIIDGELLGDAGLRVARKNEYGQAHFYYRTAREEYSRYLEEKFQVFGTTGVLKEKTREFDSYFFRTLVNPTLTDFYHRWYAGPNQKKIVPRDIELTPLVCKHWYLGDGGMRQKAGIDFFTNGFTLEDVEFLVESLNNLGFDSGYYLEHKNRSEKKYYAIHMKLQKARLFLEYIGECPVEYYKYKWNLYETGNQYFEYQYSKEIILKELGLKNFGFDYYYNKSWWPKQITKRTVGNEIRFNEEEYLLIKDSYYKYKEFTDEYKYSMADIANIFDWKSSPAGILESDWFPKNIEIRKIEGNYRFTQESFNILTKFKEKYKYSIKYIEKILNINIHPTELKWFPKDIKPIMILRSFMFTQEQFDQIIEAYNNRCKK